MSESILSNERVCYICGSPDVVVHHVFGGTANRPISDEEGCWIYLCPPHHTGREGVHFNRAMDLRVKQLCQERWEELNGGREAFRAKFGKSYL